MNWKVIGLGGAFLVATVSLHRSSDYMQSKPMRLTVLQTYVEPGGYKSSASPVMVLRTEDGRIFDRYVTYSTIYQFKPGATLIMNLRRMDIRQTWSENLVFFFGEILLFSIGVVAIGAGAFISRSSPQPQKENQ